MTNTPRQTTPHKPTSGKMSPRRTTPRETTPHPTTSLQKTSGKTNPRQTTPLETTSDPTTSPPTTPFPTAPGGLSGNFTVTLLVFSGRPDPQWKIFEVDQHYDDIIRFLGHARARSFAYSHEHMPARLGYKGFLVEFATAEYLIVGPNTKTLQELLLATMPENFRESILVEIRSGAVLPDAVATRRKRFAPIYNAAFWNNNTVTRRTNNCYNYANDKVTNTFAQPGRGSGAVFAGMNGKDVQAAAVRDGMVVLNPQLGPLAPVPGPPAGPRHLVALFVDPGNFFRPGDFHWIRLDNNGRWSHKPGQARITDLDQNRIPIIDPRNANMGNYVFISFMTTDKNVVTIV